MNDFWNQWPRVIQGAEGEADDPPAEEENDDPDDPDAGDNPEEQEENGDDDKAKADLAAVQKALEAERRITKRLDRENRRLKATQEAKKEEKDESLEATQQEAQLAKAKAEKLAAGLLRRDVDAAIKDAARELKFLDVEDALNGVDRSKIVFDQDDEDPTDIDIDLDTVKIAVKALATRKPHFLNKGTDDGDATGSPFGGSRKKKQDDEATLREYYPSL